MPLSILSAVATLLCMQGWIFAVFLAHFGQEMTKWQAEHGIKAEWNACARVKKR